MRRYLGAVLESNILCVVHSARVTYLCDLWDQKSDGALENGWDVIMDVKGAVSLKYDKHWTNGADIGWR